MTPALAASTLGQSPHTGASIQPAGPGQITLGLQQQQPVAMEMDDIDTPDVTENLYYNVTGKLVTLPHLTLFFSRENIS